MRKPWIYIASLGLTLGMIASAQGIQPTRGSGADAVDIGVDSASVSQQVNLILPAATALHLDVTDLTFDISKIGKQDNTWTCVYGSKVNDVRTKLGDNFWSQTQVLPIGTSYGRVGDGKQLTGNGLWNPQIFIEGGGSVVTQYPPVQTNKTTGELVPNSKANFICYRTFILQKFTNYGFWDLQVSRAQDGGQQALYIQDNSYCTFTHAPNAQGTGLYDLPPGTTRHLMGKALGVGPTGAEAERCLQPGGKSWLDDLMVVAVKVNGDPYGDNIADLTYTLVSSDSPFTAPQ